MIINNQFVLEAFLDPFQSGDHDMEQKCPPKCEQYDFDIDRIMVNRDFYREFIANKYFSIVIMI